jgi:K+-transporting ATPase KdpF subunit
MRGWEIPVKTCNSEQLTDFVDMRSHRPIVAPLWDIPEKNKENMIITLVGIIAVLLFVYLLAALLKPELFP